MRIIIGAVAAMLLLTALCFAQDSLPAPTLLEPADGAEFQGAQARNVLFDWSDVPQAATYEVDFSGPAGFTNPLGRFLPWPDESQLFFTFSIDGAYTWRVRAFSSDGSPGAWSEIRLFTIRVREDPTPPPTATPTETPTPHPQAAYDLNGSRHIDAADLILLSEYLHASSSQGDFNGDQATDYRDLLLFTVRWQLDWR